jgi:hypothetical protein
MNGTELKSVLGRLGLKQTEFAQLLDVSARAVSTWATGENPVPGPVAAYLRVLQSLPPEQLRLELSKLERNTEMLSNGLYRIDFTGHSGLGGGVLILQDGVISGADAADVLYDGRYSKDERGVDNIAEIVLTMPPNSRLVTGAVAGSAGARVTLRAVFPNPRPISKFRVDVAGRQVDVSLRYLRPLPN